jgi:pimeloyl-ACP methyl ester carboxylesterase
MSDEIQVRHWSASDGVDLAYRTMGEGPPVVLVHGLFSDALTNWIKFGHAEKLCAAGMRVILPDLRAHGQSAAPHAGDAYPRGILARDLAELIAHLGLESFDLGGFSLGARTTVQAVGEGLKPRRAILAGMGLEGLSGWRGRKDFFVDALANFEQSKRGDPHWLAIQFIKTMKVDRVAARLLLDSFEDSRPEWLTAFAMKTLVLCGSEDQDNGSAPRLADALPNARYAAVPGTHMSSVTRPEFGDALVAFLTAS